MKLANAIFKNKITNTIKEKYLTFDSNNEMKLAQNYLQQKVESIELEKNVNLKSTINTFKIINLNVNDNSISAIFNATGKSNLEISE